MRFLWAEGEKPAEIHRRMLALWRSENNVTQRKVYEWVEMFKEGRTSATDEARSGLA